jgi:hypothetical protein
MELTLAERKAVADCDALRGTTMVRQSLVQGVGHGGSKRALDLRDLGVLTCETAYMYVCQLASLGIRGVSHA